MTAAPASIARKYHEATKHSYWGVRRSAHVLDPATRPRLFKDYRTLTPIPLPQRRPSVDAAALGCIAGEPPPTHGKSAPTLEDLAALLFLAAGVTRRRTLLGEEHLFRAAPSTGALYEVELYVVCRALEGLPAGVYHFHPRDFALRRLRDGDYRGTLVAATGGAPWAARAPLLIVSTATYWRNAWKYQARTYRHFGWDTGTVLANLLATATGLALPARIVLGFVDAAVNRLLDLDSAEEVAYSIVALGADGAPPPPAPPDAASPLGLPVAPISAGRVEYPVMTELHAASALESADAVRAWREGPPPMPPEPFTDGIPLHATPVGECPGDSIESVIRRRGSTRQFNHAPITFGELSAAIAVATRGIPADFSPPNATRLNDLYVVAQAVDGLPAGTYVFHPTTGELGPLRAGEYRTHTGLIALEQPLAADAAACVFFLADLDPILERFGDRGYRAVQLEAGILGGKLYLAAYAQRFGATGLTFYDDDVTELFSPHAAGKSAIFLVAMGHRARGRD